MRRITTGLAATAVATVATVVLAVPAQAAPADKAQVLGQLDPDQRLQLQHLVVRPRQPGRLGRLRLRLVHRLLQQLPGQPLRLPVPELLRPARLRVPQLQGDGYLLRQQEPPRQRLLRGPEAHLRQLRRSHRERLQQHRLDLLPGGQGLRLTPAARESAARHRELRCRAASAETGQPTVPDLAISTRALVAPVREPSDLDLLDQVHALGHLAEDHVLAVEPVGDDRGDEELRAVGVRARRWPSKEDRPVVLELEVLVVELGRRRCDLPPVPLWLVKSPPWSMNSGMTRWKGEPL